MLFIYGFASKSLALTVAQLVTNRVLYPNEKIVIVKVPPSTTNKQGYYELMYCPNPLEARVNNAEQLVRVTAFCKGYLLGLKAGKTPKKSKIEIVEKT